jgi:stearoyl-CoA desaturase (delta-9 desaturase)
MFPDQHQHRDGGSFNFFWMNAFAVAMSMELVSPASHNFVQYLFPAYLAVQQCLASGGAYPTKWQVAMTLPMYIFLIGVPMSVCLHRYFSHAAFQTSRLFQFVLAVTSCFAYQGGCLWWSAKHNRHHHHCDQPDDPHSWVRQGYFYAFVGWTMNPANMSERDYKYNNPALFLRELYFLDYFYHLPPVVAFTLLEACGYGRPFVVYNIYVPMLLCRVATLLFNVTFHPPEGEMAHKRCKGIDMKQFLAEAVGESQHETHHRKPALSRRGDLDLPYYLTLFWMEPLGLIWNRR